MQNVRNRIIKPTRATHLEVDLCVLCVLCGELINAVNSYQKRDKGGMT
jgi:hypothetical protein